MNNNNFNNMQFDPMIGQSTNQQPEQPQQPKKNNKIFIIIVMLVIIGIVVGIVLFTNQDKKNPENNNSNNNSEVENNNSHLISDNINDNNKIKNIVYRNKELNIINNYKDFIIQFKGLGCNLEIPNVSFNEPIDNLDIEYINNLSVNPNENDMFWDDNSIAVVCDSGVPGSDTEFKIYFDKNDSESLGMKYSERVITKYEIYSPQETVTVNFNKGTLNLSIFVKDSTTFDNLLKQLGKYNSWELLEHSESKLTYYTSDYNIALFTFDDKEDDIINSNEIYFHGMEIAMK